MHDPHHAVNHPHHAMHDPHDDGGTVPSVRSRTTVDTTIGLAVSQQKYLPAGAGERELHAIVTVEVSGADAAAPGPALAEVLVVDCSTSMDSPEEKFRAAKNAAVAAIGLLPAGTPFAVVAGTQFGIAVYPPQVDGSSPRMAVASAATKAEAETAVRKQVAAGGTCVGNWLHRASELLAGQSAPIKHVLMLTDGRNEHDHIRPLAGVLEHTAGAFVCDAWGIGKGWDAAVLLRVTRALHGSADAVRKEAELVGAYEALVRRLLDKAVPEVTLAVEVFPGSRLRYVRQTFPNEVPMTAEPDEPGTYVTRAWGNETRRFHVCVAVDPEGQLHGEELQAAEVAVRLPEGTGVRTPVPQALVVNWTDDPALSGMTDEQVLHFRHYEQLGKAVADAAQAYHREEFERAEQLLGTAVALAERAGARRQLAELRRLVDIEDAAAGAVSLRPDIDPVDFQHLITASSHSTYGPEPGGPAPDPGVQLGAALRDCPSCSRRIPAMARFCPLCGSVLAGES
ncbi:VWA domain-containing protein [Actinacidiphila bryophytorum]|uniref:VWA domain-containing protein n=1 Tax=Actinacidiphila bryophytorum TaxID=1436133 RepID=UPI002176A981|nr:VWA domain-containing protein [Actinacidiphila bryophytorum]UWE08598.1 VWA domain-containing protein [Actinacidiphila bryophytorum]